MGLKAGQCSKTCKGETGEYIEECSPERKGSAAGLSARQCSGVEELTRRLGPALRSISLS